MKRRILALLLAGLLTASLASCVTSNKRPNLEDTGNGTEGQQTREEETTEPPVTIVWVDADDSVYVIADNVSLTAVENSDQVVKAKLMDELKRVKISSDDKRSIVEKDGVQYYVSNTYLSTDDLIGKGFAACNETMYALEAVKIRPFASLDDSFSAAIHTLKKGDEVSVVAEGRAREEGMLWRKVKFVDSETNKTYEGFVSATYLSKDPNEQIGDYSKYFVACDEETWYVNDQAEKLNLRSEPDADTGTSVRVIYKGDSVTVIAKGTDNYANWFYVKVANEKVEGLPQTYSKLYVNKNYLSQQKVELSLDELLEEYPGFEKETKVMYTTSGLNVRKTPSLTDEDNIQYPGLTQKAKVTVLATGMVDGKQWSIFEYSEGVYRFVRTSYLTPNADGTPVVTLDSILDENPGFEKVTAVDVYAKQAATGLPSFDAASDTYKKFAAGTKVTKLAEGTKDGADWYVVKDSEGGYYFVGAEFFDENQMQG